MKRSILLVVALFSWAIAATSARACDVCSVQGAAVDNLRIQGGSWRFSLENRFSDFSLIERDGKKVFGAGPEYVRTSATTLFTSYDVSDRFSAQVVLPTFSRRFRAIDGGVERAGTIAGLGDISILGRFVPYYYNEGGVRAQLALFSGLKLPTGESGELREHHHDEVGHEHHHEEVGHGDYLGDGEHHHEESAIHGHDLALGSGSYDIPVGWSFIYEADRFFLTSDMQYTFRREGTGGFRYGNDLMLTLSPGYKFVSEHLWSVAARGMVTAEHKDSDREHGVLDHGRASRLFVGPQFLVTYNRNYSWFLGADIPVHVHADGLQAVIKYRTRAGLTVRF
jgi:hypothetical protein